jgi:hypothetical protein
MSNHITPTIGRIVWYRGEDGNIRAAIVTAVHSNFSLNLYVFGSNKMDSDCCCKDNVTHADPEQEPGCFPSWHWMPYQKQQAASRASVGTASGSTTIGANLAQAGSDAAIEQQIQAKGKTAPRVTPLALQDNILREHYFTAGDGVMHARRDEGFVADPRGPLQLLTFCVLVLQNGFTVTGESACASPENFDAEIGRQVARENAMQKVWPLMGYALKQQLHDADCEYALLHGQVRE